MCVTKSYLNNSDDNLKRRVFKQVHRLQSQISAVMRMRRFLNEAIFLVAPTLLTYLENVERNDFLEGSVVEMVETG